MAPRSKEMSAHRRIESSSADVITSLASLCNLGPRSAHALAAAGIASLEELQGIGSVAAYARVKLIEPKASLNLLWALEGAVSGLHWQEVARQHRTSLLLALESHQREAAATPVSSEPPREGGKNVRNALPIHPTRRRLPTSAA